MSSFTKEKILYSANKIITMKGLNDFTLKEVAREAGVSKSGLLYHYPSKDMLIKGMIDDCIQKFESRVYERTNGMPDLYPYDWVISFTKEQFNQTSEESNLVSGVLAAAATNKEFLEPFLSKRREWMEKIAEAYDPTIGPLICSVCDGLVFSNLLRINVISEDMKGKMLQALISFIL